MFFALKLHFLRTKSHCWDQTSYYSFSGRRKKIHPLEFKFGSSCVLIFSKNAGGSSDGGDGGREPEKRKMERIKTERELVRGQRKNAKGKRSCLWQSLSLPAPRRLHKMSAWLRWDVQTQLQIITNGVFSHRNTDWGAVIPAERDAHADVIQCLSQSGSIGWK